MRHRRVLPTLMSLSFAALASAAGAQTVFNVATWLPTTHAISKTQAKWCETIALESSGRMRCNVLPKSPVPTGKTYDAVAAGELDVSFTVHGYTPGRFVLTQMAEMPFLGDQSEALSVAYQRVANRYPQFAAEHAGVKPLAVFTHGPGALFTGKKAVGTLADVQGLPMRIGGGMATEVAKALGMNGVQRPASETAELLKAGTVEGVLFPAESVEAFKIDKLVHHGVGFPGGLYNTSFVFMMNAAKYNQLSADDRRIIDKYSGETMARLFGRAWDDADRKGLAYMQVANVSLKPASDKLLAEVKPRLAPLEQKWVAAAEAKGLPGASKVLAEFRSELGKAGK